ncbi:hypothetical protein NLJ89_g6658 [Agrocybe chaxingu]|uniref:DUF6534 domain-containing protein n=1 Tax=Agrocybe chaxingu TaxID=84603 RepID=A0A9W8JYC5_9AGAR|nr:hypothetical protein NLJ89_g6658 [Agrocybe chaxingu]
MSSLLSQFPIESTAGAALIGTYLAAVMYGFTILQTYQYFSRYWRKDRTYIYILVITLTILDTLALVFNIHMMWHFLIANYCNPITFLFADWSTLLSILTNAVTGIIVQAFYAYRLWILSDRKHYLASILIILFGLGALASCTVYMAYLFKFGTFLHVVRLAYLPTMYYSFSIAADALITFGITYLLLKNHSDGVRSFKTDNVIRRLIAYTLNAGAITTLCCVISLILCRALPQTYYDLLFSLPLSKLYVNSMLAFLNAREGLRKKGGSIAVNLTTSKTTSYEMDTKIQDRVNNSENRPSSPFSPFFGPSSAFKSAAA